MGTHPIFESDFDCLTEWRLHRDEVNKYDASIIRMLIWRKTTALET